MFLTILIKVLNIFLNMFKKDEVVDEVVEEEIKKEVKVKEEKTMKEINEKEQQALSTIYTKGFKFVKEIGKFKIAIIGQGSHPCAYVAMPKDIFIDTDFISVHGGITYEDDGLHEVIEEEKYYVIGWDYAHLGDFNAFFDSFDSENKIYTINDVLNDIEDVSKQIVKMIEDRAFALKNADVTGY